MDWWGLRMTTPLTLTRPATIHCLARFFGVSGCSRSNQSNSGLAFVSITGLGPRHRLPVSASSALILNHRYGWRQAHFKSDFRFRSRAKVERVAVSWRRWSAI